MPHVQELDGMKDGDKPQPVRFRGQSPDVWHLFVSAQASKKCFFHSGAAFAVLELSLLDIDRENVYCFDLS